MNPNKKSSILLVLKILEEYTDEDHYLTQIEIASKIYADFDIDLERKSIGSSLSMLEELGYDIDKGSKGGYALLSRTFDDTEASYLIDAIFSSRSIDGRRAKIISEEIASCFSRYKRKDYSYIYKSSEINRTDNKNVLYNIAIINEAIKQKKRVGFQYLEYDSNGNPKARRDGYQFIVSPYYLINNYGRYYLLCNYREKYHPIQTFRVDYMMNIEIKKEWDIKKMCDLENAPRDFSITKYINNHIYMFGGDLVDATLELNEEWCILYIKDWFGDNARIKKVNDKIQAYIRCNETALYYWIMQYADCVKVISPDYFVNRVKDGLKKALNKYE